MFIYPDNLKAKATLWLWELRDVAIIGVGFLFSVLAIAQTGILLPLVVTVRRMLDEKGGRWQTTGSGIVSACERLCGEGPATGQEAAAFLEELAPRLKERDGILWRCRSHGTRGRVHLFTRL